MRLVRTRTVLFASIGGGFQLLVVSAIYSWLPSYLNRYEGLSTGQAGIRTGLIMLVGGLGAVLWSVVADRLAPRVACARLYVPAVVAVMTTVFMCATFIAASPGELQYWLLAAGALVMTGTIGPVAAAVMDVSQPGLRATSASILAFIQNLLGLAGGPLLAGALADIYGLRLALSVVPVLCLLAAFMFLLAARTYLTDMRGLEIGEEFGGALAAQQM